MKPEIRGDPSIRRTLRLCAGLGLSALLVLSAFNGPAMARSHGGGAGGHSGGGGHSNGGGGERNGGGGHDNGGAGRRGDGRYGGGYGGWNGGYYPEPALIYGSPYYCAPPLLYVPDDGYGYCE